MVLRTVRARPDLPFFNTLCPGGRIHSVTWSAALDHMASLAAWWDDRGIRPGQRVCCLTPNSYGMFIWEFTAMATGRVSVPLYARLRPEVMRPLLKELSPRAVLTETGELGVLARSILGDRVPILSLDDLGRILEAPAPAAALLRSIREARPDDVALIQYTSGTTGEMKGVQLTHRNLMSEQAAFARIWELPPGARFLSYLPWHHSFGGIFERFTAVARGARLMLEPSAGKDPAALLRSWRRVRPTHFFSVPKVYVGLMNAAKRSARVRGILFHPELRLLFTAGAPLPAECTRFFEEHGARIMEGWGLTETSPTVTLTRLDEPRIHSIVGRPIPGVRIRISGQGEILVKGPNVMKGYFHRPDLTRRVFGPGGWFHTGDIGEMTPAGLRIICRKDGVFKLLNGLKVPSLPLEEALTLSSRHILHAVAVGEGRDHAGILVFPDPSLFPACRKGNSAVMERLREEILQNIRPFLGTAWEVRAVAVVCEDLSVEAGDLTPTLKIVRRAVLERFRRWVEAIYRPASYPRLQPFILRFNPRHGPLGES
jgi:long-subunit acyl-CoA synthetase (AMP-forming)